MQSRSFTAVVQAGHKEHAVEVPFDPVQLWGRKARRFAQGRRGVEVRGQVQGVAFTSQIVSRSGKHWLLLPPESELAAGLQVGVEASILLSPSAAA